MANSIEEREPHNFLSLPRDVQKNIVARLGVHDIARLALVNRDMNELSKRAPQFKMLLRGSDRQGPLPEHPRRQVGHILKSYGGWANWAIRRMMKNGTSGLPDLPEHCTGCRLGAFLGQFENREIVMEAVEAEPIALKRAALFMAAEKAALLAHLTGYGPG